jgi:hypothetical protein
MRANFEKKNKKFRKCKISLFHVRSRRKGLTWSTLGFGKENVKNTTKHRGNPRRWTPPQCVLRLCTSCTLVVHELFPIQFR